MGLFDWVMHGLGFETSNKKDKKSKTVTADKYANFNLHEKVAGETNNLESAPSASNINTLGGFMQPESNIIMVEPKTLKEVQTVVDYLRQGQSVAVNLEGIVDAERERILDFLSGALYGINGSIHRWHGDLFLLTPEGHKILRPE